MTSASCLNNVELAKLVVTKTMFLLNPHVGPFHSRLALTRIVIKVTLPVKLYVAM